MSSRPELKLDWCSYEAAKYAVEHWHYSRSMPAAMTVHVGAWEGGKFIGAVIFGRGANRNMARPYRLGDFQIAELVRVALTIHSSPVSRIVSIAVKMIARQSPGLRLIVSYADPEQGHHGGIYQAMNWIHAGESLGSEKVWYNGRWAHKRTVDSKYGNHKGFKTKKTSRKHTYLMPLDPEIRAQILPLAKPYPKRKLAPEALPDDAPRTPAGKEGGSIPTSALQGLATATQLKVD